MRVSKEAANNGDQEKTGGARGRPDGNAPSGVKRTASTGTLAGTTSMTATSDERCSVGIAI